MSGVSSEGLSTTVQPAASAGDTLRVIIEKGKFLRLGSGWAGHGGHGAYQQGNAVGTGGHAAMQAAAGCSAAD